MKAMRKLAANHWSFNTRDLMRSSGCSHCSQLAIASQLEVSGLNELLEQYYVEPDNLAITYGMAFEAALEQELLTCLGKENFQRPEGKDQFAATVDLMRAKIPVIFQGYIEHRVGLLQFHGKPDFLVRDDYELYFENRVLGARHIPGYETKGKYVAWDAKLASSAKPNYLLQIALYADALLALGMQSEKETGLILGSRKLVSFEDSEIVPAMKSARAELASAISSFDEKIALEDLTLYCDTKDSCKVCEYPALCDQARLDSDHLVQVAGINRSQIEKFKLAGLDTMAKLSTARDEDKPTEITAATFDKLRTQARLQTDYKLTGTFSHLVLPDPEIAVLPPASANDIFFDMEGFPYYPEEGGLEYLFGSSFRDGTFEAFFAHDRVQEKKALKDFVSFVTTKLSQDKSAHIYHYASYEVTALTRLAARHGILEKEVSELVSSGRMIDLFKVVKGSIMVSQHSYSIKKLEAFYEFARKSKVLDAGSSIDEYDYYRQLVELADSKAKEVLQQITDYNQDDCVSTMGLYNWLSSLEGAHSRYQEFQRAKDIKKAREAKRQDSREDSPESQRAKKAERDLERLIQKTSALVAKLDNWKWGLSGRADY
jgi:uncharacterized protein